MLDVKGVGSNLTLAEQDEAIADLTFFFDEFGSTGAVRDKLEEQESDIKLLHHQIRRLLNHQSDGFVREEGERDKKSRTDIAEDVDETMKNLDFFIRTFGSTRQVREKLERQRVKVVGLRRTVRWLKERQPARVNLGESSDVEVLAETSKSNVGMLDVSLADTPCGETTGTDRNDANDTGTVGQLQESKVQHVDCGLKGDLERSQSILATGVRSPTASRKEKSCCRVLGCSTRATVRGLCYAHGGYYICKTEGCTKRAISRHLCRFHGGGTKCKSDGCEKLGLPTGKGFCYKHARENGIQVKPNCKIEGCTNLRQKFGRCKRHRDVPIESGTDKNDK